MCTSCNRKVANKAQSRWQHKRGCTKYQIAMAVAQHTEPLAMKKQSKQKKPFVIISFSDILILFMT